MAEIGKGEGTGESDTSECWTLGGGENGVGCGVGREGHDRVSATTFAATEVCWISLVNSDMSASWRADGQTKVDKHGREWKIDKTEVEQS